MLKLKPYQKKVGGEDKLLDIGLGNDFFRCDKPTARTTTKNQQVELHQTKKLKTFCRANGRTK